MGGDGLAMEWRWAQSGGRLCEEICSACAERVQTCGVSPRKYEFSTKPRDSGPAEMQRYKGAEGDGA